MYFGGQDLLVALTGYIGQQENFFGQIGKQVFLFQMLEQMWQIQIEGNVVLKQNKLLTISDEKILKNKWNVKLTKFDQGWFVKYYFWDVE